MKRLIMLLALFALPMSFLMLAPRASSHEHGHGHDDHAKAEIAQPWTAIERAVAVAHPTAGSEVHGVVRFNTVENGVQVIADFHGLPPNSRHGFHVHEFGDCTATDATTAGGHYNPQGHPHGLPNGDERHAGDFGNLETDEQGNAHIEFTVSNITVAGALNPVLGRSVIVHEKADDGGQPTGNAGGRVACGVIGVAK